MHNDEHKESSVSDIYSLELRVNKNHPNHLEENEDNAENDCSVLSDFDFVSALSVDMLQETFNTAESDSQSSPYLCHLESEQIDPFLYQSEILETNEENFRVEKTIVYMHSSETKDKKKYSAYCGMSPSLLQYMVMFLVMLTHPVHHPGDSLQPGDTPW